MTRSVFSIVSGLVEIVEGGGLTGETQSGPVRWLERLRSMEVLALYPSLEGKAARLVGQHWQGG